VTTHLPTPAGVRPGRRSLRAALLAALGAAALLLFAALLPGAALAADERNAPSPAQAPAAVVAQGVGAMPAELVAWRVVRDVAELPGAARFEERAIGFTVAGADAILLTDQLDGEQTRLAAGEAAFVAEATDQMRESLGEAPSPYYRLALVPSADAGFTNGDQLVFAGGEFEAPSGRRDLDLVQARLGLEQTTQFPATGFQTVLLATAGRLEILVEGSEPIGIEAGQAGTVLGAFALRGASEGVAEAVVGLIGPEVPPPPATPATPPPPPAAPLGSISVQVIGCPAGTAHADLQERCVALYLDDDGDPATGQRTLDDATPSQNAVGWTGLPLGDWTLSYETGSVYKVESATDAGAVGEPSGNTATVLPIRLTAENPDVLLQIHVADPRPGPESEPKTGSIAFHVYACPEWVEAGTASPADCEPAPHPAPHVYGPDGDLAGEHDGDGHWTWDELPYGSYGVGLADDASYLIPELPGSSVEGGYGLTLDAEHPTYELTLYDLHDPADEDQAEEEHAEDEGDPDPDGDGLADGEEAGHLHQTDPLDEDSDDDGATDGEEIAAGTDPLTADAAPDAEDPDPTEDAPDPADEEQPDPAEEEQAEPEQEPEAEPTEPEAGEGEPIEDGESASPDEEDPSSSEEV
jgi:Bacterial TSP3 repeat